MILMTATVPIRGMHLRPDQAAGPAATSFMTLAGAGLAGPMNSNSGLNAEVASVRAASAPDTGPPMSTWTGRPPRQPRENPEAAAGAAAAAERQATTDDHAQVHSSAHVPRGTMGPPFSPNPVSVFCPRELSCPEK